MEISIWRTCRIARSMANVACRATRFVEIGEMSALRKEARDYDGGMYGGTARHVRKLDFGNSILQVNAESGFYGRQRRQHDRVLVLDQPIGRLPCTVKENLVKKWLETHDHGNLVDTENTTQHSTSPILGRGCAYKAESRSSPIERESSTAMKFSPVFSRHLRPIENIPKTAQRRSPSIRQCHTSKLIGQCSPVPTSTYLTHKREREKDDPLRHDAKRKSINFPKPFNFCSLKSHVENDMESSPTDGKESQEIETQSSGSTSCDNYNVLSSSDDERDNARYDSVEDSKRENETLAIVPPNPSNLTSSLPHVKSLMKMSGPWMDDPCISEDTFRGSTPFTESPDSKLYRIDTDLTSAGTPRKTAANGINYANLLDSGKKRRKPKKGSLLAKLRTMINREKSFMRIWQHQKMHREFENIRVPFMEIHVKTCTTRFSKQFLEGIVTDECNFSKSPSPVGSSYAGTFITIIVVPEIAGIIEIKSGERVKIYPPWDVIHCPNVIISASKISTERCNGETFITEPVKGKKLGNCVRKFECDCTKENEINRRCTEWKTDTKPNVMEIVFNA